MKTLVDSGALTLALNVLRRAGKDEVADALQATAVRDDGQQPVGRLLVAPGDSWPTLTREGDEALWDLPPGEYKLYLRPQTEAHAETSPQCPTCQDDAVWATDGAGPFDCYDCGRKAQNPPKCYAHETECSTCKNVINKCVSLFKPKENIP